MAVVVPEPETIPMPTEWDQISYTYDPAGRRIEKKYDTTTVVKYVYDGSHCLAEYDGNNQLLRKYIYGPGVDEPICMIEVADSNAVSYYHFDALGSCVALSGADGNTAVLYEYSVYGQVAASDPNHPNRFMFTGREFDQETGLYYYRARYYHPEIGRFLQTDPIGYGDGMNMYGFCGNRPSVLADPSGMASDFGFSYDEDEDGYGWVNMMFSWTDDDGTPRHEHFGSIDSWITWAAQGGEYLVFEEDEDGNWIIGDDGMYKYERRYLFPEGWGAGQIGWRLSGGNNWIFWHVKALMWLNGTFDYMISTLEVMATTTIKRSAGWGYNWDKNIIYFNIVQENEDTNWSPRWLNAPKVVWFAHEITHAFTDWALVHYAGISLTNEMSDTALRSVEQVAVAGENSLRRSLFMVSPSARGERRLWPRTGYHASVPDVPGATDAQEAWGSFDGSFQWE